MQLKKRNENETRLRGACASELSDDRSLAKVDTESMMEVTPTKKRGKGKSLPRLCLSSEGCQQHDDGRQALLFGRAQRILKHLAVVHAQALVKSILPLVILNGPEDDALHATQGLLERHRLPAAKAACDDRGVLSPDLDASAEVVHDATLHHLILRQLGRINLLHALHESIDLASS